VHYVGNLKQVYTLVHDQKNIRLDPLMVAVTHI